MALAFRVISWTARYPKSISFSGWPMAKAAPPPEWPVSVLAAAYPRRIAPASPPLLISPDQPPFPTDCSLPFQPDSGIQTSILISESFEGVKVAATRQYGGRFWSAA